jgi:asparagine synthase (glutamine-hydrolysing)
MLRYIGLAWDKRSDTQRATALSLIARLDGLPGIWNRALSTDGLHVHITDRNAKPSQCLPLVGQSGVVLGAVFSRSSAEEIDVEPRPLVCDQDTSARIVQSGGEYLINASWGSYVAIVRDARRDTTWILRSPRGSLPCFRLSYRGVQVFFSYLPDCVSLGLVQFSINWNAVARHVLKTLHTEETCLIDVLEVHYGDCVEVHQGRVTTHHYWDMHAVALSDPIEDPARAAHAVRQATKACVNAWASRHSSILHALSGGLDSSIVAACLGRAGSRPRVKCLNAYSPGSRSDEREYARLAASSSGLELIESLRNPALRFSDALNASVSARPQPYLARLEQMATELQHSSALGATAIFGGNCGDEVFMKPYPGFCAVDYVHRHGVDRGLLDVLLHASELSGISVWVALAQALRQRILPHRWDVTAFAGHYHAMINPEVLIELDKATRVDASWCRRGSGLPIGKQAHLHFMIYPEIDYRPLQEPGEPDHISPLGSQPLVELCARIPTYILSRRGWDRAVAREAFATDLPVELIRRRSKGGVGEFAYDVIRRNLSFTRDLLLQGSLMQEGFLDRRKVEEALSGRTSGVLKGLSKVFLYLTIEMWLTICKQNRMRAAA